LNKFVEDIDTLLNSLFHFPVITWKGILSILVPVLAVTYYLRDFLSGLWSQNVNANLYHTMITAVGTVVSIIIGLYLLNLALSFVDKRRFFLYPEYEAIKLRDRMKKRSEAFLGSKIRSTIYDKENKLYRSLGIEFKDAEQPVDIMILMIFAAFFFWIIPVGVNIYLFPYLFWLLILPITLILVRRRSANNVV
jgi:hypothetical protein